MPYQKTLYSTILSYSKKKSRFITYLPASIPKVGGSFIKTLPFICLGLFLMIALKCSRTAFFKDSSAAFFIPSNPSLNFP